MSKSNDPFEEEIDRLADLFEDEFRRGSKPQIEAYLANQSIVLRPHLLRELLRLELELRLRVGEKPTINEYRQRFPDYLNIVELVFVPATEIATTATEQAVVSEPQSEEEIPLPKKIGRYEVRRRLGLGGFGVVYLAWDPNLKRHVAVKVARRDRFKTAEKVATFILEGSKTAVLKHDLLVTIYDVGEEDGLPYIVQEYIAGENLAEWAAKRQPSFSQVVQILMGVAEALGFVHQHRLTHCDLKLANVLMDQDGKPHVADFGLAVHESARLHSKGARFGTPPMMAPEQVRGEGHRLDGRTDIWAMGVMMYQLLVTRKPFTATDRAELFNEIETLDPTPPRQIDRTVPRELERICLKCLSKRRTDRYNSADDLREDLQVWLSQHASTEPPHAMTAFELDGTSPKSHSSAPQFPKIIPKGLRSYDAKDADFFIELLPGPRDRDGLPESIRFWKDRIEADVADETFSVGLIYGPSGCGKSSLVKAGLLPRLNTAVLAIYVEATAADTEVRLLKQLHRHFPKLSTDVSLVAACEEIRRTGAGRNRKLLVVIDQFEQWLHAHDEIKQTQLVDSLRQCDGGKLQVILLVRDDFYASVNRMFNELDIKLVEGKNFALVDRFDKSHARKVLTLFGRAYEKLDDKLSAANEIFLTEVVEGLAEDAKVISVRLSLFADMMKSRPWTVESLKEVGGVRGVGVTFLEETFNSKTAPPSHRVHEKAVRKLLASLLPESGIDIRGGMRSEQSLCEVTGYPQGSPQFADAINILDAEVRIITPTEPDGEGSSSNQSAKNKYYQLTHDYLVPSLRSWLMQKLHETSKGRAEIALQERAALWNAKPENRFLPSLWEYVAIRVLLDAECGIESKRKMMKAADIFYGLRSGIFVASLAIVVGLILWSEAQRRSDAAEELVGRIVVAAPFEVIPMIFKEPRLRRELEWQLRDKLENVHGQPDVEVRIRLGLLPFDAEQARPLSVLILRAHDGDIEAIARYLQPYGHLVNADLVAATRDKARSNHERLVALAALGIISSHESFWNELADETAALIVREDIGTARSWGRMLRDVGEMEGPLCQSFRDWKHSPAGSSAAAALADYLSDSPEKSCKLIVSADSQQCRILADGLSRQQNVALEILSDIQGASVEEKVNIIIAKLILGNGSTFWTELGGLGATGDPTLRAHLIQRWQTAGVSTKALFDNLDSKREGAIIQATVLILHSLPELLLTSAEKENAGKRLVELFIHHSDAGVHSAAELVLRKWQYSQVDDDAILSRFPSAPDLSVSTDPTSVGWFADKNSHVMVWSTRDREFEMGLRDTELNEIAPLHKRRIPRNVAIATKETTLRQFLKLVSSDDLTDNAQELDSDVPVANIAWPLMARYCNRLSAINKIPQEEWCYCEEDSSLVLANGFLNRLGYRLPTEGEWEYFCRAGTNTDWYCGDDASLLDEYAWSSRNSPSIPKFRRSPVGRLIPNRFGLFDMSGNVWEYCQSAFEPPRTNSGSIVNDDDAQLGSPSEPCVIRGGSFGNSPKTLRSGHRMPHASQIGDEFLGFRVARTLGKR